MWFPRAIPWELEAPHSDLWHPPLVGGWGAKHPLFKDSQISVLELLVTVGQLESRCNFETNSQAHEETTSTVY